MLKVFTVQSLVTKQNRTSIFPILLDVCYTHTEEIKDYYQLVANLATADICIFPIDINRCVERDIRDKLNAFMKTCKKAGKPIWVYSSGDIGVTMEDDTVYSFRLGGFNTKLGKRTCILPAHISFPLEQLPFDVKRLASKKKKPTVGFVGLAHSGIFQYLKSRILHFKRQWQHWLGTHILDKQPYYDASGKRFSYLKRLKQDKRIDTDFKLRKKYRAGITKEQERFETTLEFYENIHKNLYTFCMRGGGNFSVRFFETLALGRIPILVNTDCRLPFHNAVNWNKHCIIIEEHDVARLPTLVKDFHDSTSKEELRAMQVSNRKLWEDKLRHQSFFIEIHDIFTQNK